MSKTIKSHSKKLILIKNGDFLFNIYFMKKFSNVSNVFVGKEPKLVEPTKQEAEVIQFKNEVMKLMDDFLSIRSYGVARPEIMIPTKIVGKEMFVEALADLITSKSNKEQIKALESLKSTNKDWKSIEDKIDSIEDINIDLKESKKINDLIEKYSDEEDLKFFLDSHVKKSTKEKAYQKHQVAEKMFNKTRNPLLKVVSDKYLDFYKN